MHPIKEYFNNSAAALNHQYKLAGVSGHKGDSGANREELLQGWINQHIPERLKCILGGKVLGLNGDISKQIDCLVISDIVPRFELQHRTISIVESLSMGISVKSNLDKHQLWDSLDNLRSIPPISDSVISETGVLSNPESLARMKKRIPRLVIWAYEGIHPDNLVKHLIEWCANNPNVPIERLPSDILVNQKYIIKRSIEPMLANDGKTIPANQWYPFFIDKFPGCALCSLVVELTNAVTWLNDIGINFYHYANAALEA